MKIYKISILFFFFIILPLLQISGQVQNNGLDVNYKISTPTTPEVSSLMKRIDYPTNLYTGKVEIDIPLYTIDAGEIKIPISISYDHSGIKVKELSGNIGVGWSLNVGPSLSRKINGIADDSPNGFLTTQGGASHSIRYAYYRGVINGSFDEEPDSFYYKLLNKSGKFYFRRNIWVTDPAPAQVVLHPYEPIKVYPNLPVYGGLGYFDIIDDSGFQYKFGGAYSSNIYQKASSWKISEITSPTGKDRVNFHYNGNSKYTYLPQETDRIIIEELIPGEGRYSSIKPMPPTISFTNSNTQMCYRIENDINGGQKLVYTNENDINYQSPGFITLTEQLLTYISTTYVTVSFSYNSNNECTTIEVYDNISNQRIQTILFQISDCFQPEDPTSLKAFRRKLDRVIIYNQEGSQLEYKFDYNNPESLPKDMYFCKDVDHWGYYNGANNPKYNMDGRPASAVPKHEISYYDINSRFSTLSIGDANKEANPYYMKIGILSSISYPTGRITRFEYEAHEYEDNFSFQKKYAGGLRIATITELNPRGEEIVTTYKYGQKEDGVGNIIQPISYNNYCYEKIYCNLVNSGSTNNPGYLYEEYSRARFFQAEPIVDLFNENGASVTYDQVVEYKYSSKSGLFSKIVYKYPYQQYSSIPNRMYGTTCIFSLDNGWAYGHLLSQKEYKYNNGNFNPVKEITYNYDTFTYHRSLINSTKTYQYIEFRNTIENSSDANRIRESLGHKQSYFESLYSVGVGQGGSPIGGYINYSSFIVSGCKKLMNETSKIWNQSDSITETITYNYDNEDHMYPTKVTRVNSDGLMSLEKTIYPQDTIFNLSSSREAGRNALVIRNMLNTVIEKHTIKGRKQWKVKNIYTPLPYTRFPALSKITTSINDNNDDERVAISFYDKNRNPICINKAGVDIVYIWGYSGRHPIAEIVGLDYTDLVRLITPICPDINNLSEVISEKDIVDLRNIFMHDYLMTTYIYDPVFGLTSITNPSAVTIHYEYDSWGRLIRTKDMDGNTIQQYSYNYGDRRPL